MSLVEGLALFLAGLGAGVCNVMAGGGSLISVTLMIFLGLPPTVANATGRPAIIAQNILAVLGFRRARIYRDPVFRVSTLLLAAAALPGSLAGAYVAATKVSDTTFQRLLAVVMLLVAMVTWWRFRCGGLGTDPLRQRRPLFLLAAFFVMGFYGGFIQAGVGFFMIAAFLHGSSWDMVRVNAAKVLIVLIYTAAALLVFTGNWLVDWNAAAWVIAGQAAGGMLGARAALRLPESSVLKVYLVLLLAFATKLAFF